MTDPRLSVVIPAFNHGRYLTGCLNSIMTCGIDGVEVVVIDDGSTDDTAEIVKAAAPSVRYFRQENAGPAAARNRGFEVSTGDYVLFLDSDDQLVPGSMGRLAGVLDRHPEIPLVFGDCHMGTFEDGFTSVISKFGGEDFDALPGEPIECGVVRFERSPFFRQLSRRNVVFLGSLLVRREALADSGGFDRSLVGAADWEFVMRLAEKTQFTCDRGTSVAYYLQYPSSMSKDQDHMELEFAKALRQILKVPLSVEDRRWIGERLATQEFGYAYQAYERGDRELARERFAACFRSRTDLKSLVYWFATHLPPKLLESSRIIKRGILG